MYQKERKLKKTLILMYSFGGVLFPGQSRAHSLGIGPSAAVPRNWSITYKLLTWTKQYCEACSSTSVCDSYDRQSSCAEQRLHITAFCWIMSQNWDTAPFPGTACPVSTLKICTEPCTSIHLTPLNLSIMQVF